MSPKKIHLGFTAEDEVCKLLAAKQIDEVLVKELRLQSRTFVAKIFKKLFVRNPLGFVIVRSAICMNPRIIAKESEVVLQAKMKKLIMKLVSLKYVVSKW